MIAVSEQLGPAIIQASMYVAASGEQILQYLGHTNKITCFSDPPTLFFPTCMGLFLFRILKLFQ